MLNNNENNINNDEVTSFVALGTIAFLGLIVIALGFFIFSKKPNDSQNAVKDKNNIKSSIVMMSVDPFNDIILEAKAAFVWDVNKQEIIYARNEEAQLPLASLTKLMTALVAYEILPESTVVTITKDSLASEGDSGLFIGEQWRVEDLLGLTLLGSSNDGARAIASVAGSFKNNIPKQGAKNRETFVHLMNEKAKEIGLTQTYFLNETGLDTYNYASGGYGSARDMSILLEYITENARTVTDVTRYDVFEFLSLNNINHIITNTNKAVGSIPGLIASKTGFTDLAGGNLVVSFDAGINHPIIISVLGSTLSGRFRDVQKLTEASLKKLAQ